MQVIWVTVKVRKSTPPVEVGGGLLSTSICLTPKLELFLAAFIHCPLLWIPQACCVHHSMKQLITYFCHIVQAFVLWYLLCFPSGMIQLLKQGHFRVTPSPCTMMVLRRSTVNNHRRTAQVFFPYFPTKKSAVSATMGILADYMRTSPKELSV